MSFGAEPTQWLCATARSTSTIAGCNAHHRPLEVPLPAVFFDRPADQVARDLPGQMLVRRIGPHWRSLMVTETEADIGPRDLASHAARVRVLQRAWPTRALLVAAEASLCLGM